MNYFSIINTIAIILIMLGCISLLFTIILNLWNKKNLNPVKSKPSIAIMIPARDESEVIEGLIKSIQQQTFKIKMDNVYIIVEDKEDPTCDIAKKYKCNIIVRKKNCISKKGLALDEGFKELIKKKKFYDLYFIFDADNILEKKFIEKVIPFYEYGYDIVSSHRAIKNKTRNLISLCSILTFSLINGICNEIKTKQNGNITITGTGYFIKGSLIEKWNGFPFSTLTEDYELTLYSILHQLKTAYNSQAIFFDEQPTKYNVSKRQRIRWIRGYLDARKQYISKLKKSLKVDDLNIGSKIQEIVGLWPILGIIVGIMLLFFNNLITALYFTTNYNQLSLLYFSIIPYIVISCYIILSIITTILIEYDSKNMKLSSWEKIKVLLFHPIFLFTYIPCAIKALFNKNMAWDKIEHTEKTSLLLTK